MKTTIEIPDTVLTAARRFAAHEGMTLRSVVEMALRRLLEEHSRSAAFHLRDASVTGRGLQPGFRDADWARVRDAAYDGRGS